MTTVSFVTQLTSVSKWLTSGHQICCRDGCPHRSISCCSSWSVAGFVLYTGSFRYPHEKKTGLHLVIVGGTQQILCVLSIGRENCCQDRSWHHDGNVGVPCLVDTTCHHVHVGDVRQEQWILEACWGMQHQSLFLRRRMISHFAYLNHGKIFCCSIW